MEDRLARGGLLRLRKGLASATERVRTRVFEGQRSRVEVALALAC